MQRGAGQSSVMGRRAFLALGVGAAAATLVSDPVEAAIRAVPERSVNLYNTHTGESLKTVYWARGRYVPSSLSTVNHFLRDHRNGEIHPMDPRLLDLMCAVQTLCGTRGAVHIISGYRSPATNALLVSTTDGVASHSLHMQGKAIDIRLPGRSVRLTGRAARSLHAGGVGQYPASDFVHIDTGRVRYW